MKSACVVLRKNKSDFSDGYTVVLNAFYAVGYTFEEVRIFAQEDELLVSNGLSALIKTYDVVTFLVDKTFFSKAKKYMTSVFAEGIYQGGFNGAGIYEDKDKTLFLLSSDDSDTGAEYVKNTCVPYLNKKYGIRYDRAFIRAMGANEMLVERLLSEAKVNTGELIEYHHVRRYDEDVIELSYDGKAPKMLVDDTLRLFADGLGESVYAFENIKLEEQLVRLLKLRGKRISVAESFTGGGIGRRIVSVSGASAVYFEGLNTYNERSKMKRLGVSEYTLKTLGAVSDQTAYEMAAGLIASGDCDVSIATTGLAGPKSDRSMLPVGLCYIAVGLRERVFVYRYRFDGTRENITETAINYALFLAYMQLKNL